VTLVGACQLADPSHSLYACTNDSQCVSGFQCINGMCQTSGSDASAGDAANRADAGVFSDAGVGLDASPGVDASESDAAVVDSGERPDAVFPDSGSVDSGTIDAGLTQDAGCSPGLFRCNDGCCSAVGLGLGLIDTCAVLNDGTLRCWGDNSYGEVAQRDGGTFTTPMDVGLADIGGVAIGSYHVCAYQTSSPQVFCWGLNSEGQLGDETTVNSNVPKGALVDVCSATGIAAGASHSCSNNTSLASYCWGANQEGQLGIGDAGLSDAGFEWVPVTVDYTGTTGSLTIVPGHGNHTCALDAMGSVLCWGNNGSGQVGDGTTVDRGAPTRVKGLPTGNKVVSAGALHTCAVRPDNSVVCWGDNLFGQLGVTLMKPDGGVATLSKIPVVVPSVTAASVSAGEGHTCAITTNGGAVCWGSNYDGQIGNGSPTSEPPVPPTPVSGFGTGVAMLVAGDNHNCAVTTAGVMWCWGDNTAGELGDGTMQNRTTPVPVISP
jgi:alpha-tubulin suppressor-like RCC1 family protein